MLLNNNEGGEVYVAELSGEIGTLNDLDSSDQDIGHYEGVFGTSHFKTYLWYRTGLDRASSVGKILNKFDSHVGTGFVVRGRDLSSRLSDAPVLITNAHVVSPSPNEQSFPMPPQAIKPSEAKVVFETHSDQPPITDLKVVYTSPRRKLDFTILSLPSGVAARVKPLPISTRAPDVDKRVYIIGHPEGSGLSFSIQDNQVTSVLRDKLQYLAPTRRGNSGSPVFNEGWDVVGLHHREVNNANQGILLSHIISHLKHRDILST